MDHEASHLGSTEQLSLTPTCSDTPVLQGAPAHAGRGLGAGSVPGNSLEESRVVCSGSAPVTLLWYQNPLTPPGEPVHIFLQTAQMGQARDPDGTGGFPYLQHDFGRYSSSCSAKQCPELTHFAMCMSFTGTVSLFTALSCSAWLYPRVFLQLHQFGFVNPHL